MMNILICTPTYSGQVHAAYAVSLTETICLLRQRGIGAEVHISAGSSLLAAERNRLVEHFWNSTATHMLCVDADLGWPAQAVPAMLATQRDLVCGVYPARDKERVFLFRPRKDAEGRIVQDGHLVGMDYVPAGFLLLSRDCIRKMREAHPGLLCVPKKDNGDRFHALFDNAVYEGEYWGEDFTFCRHAREAGIEIWADPLIEFDHAGVRGMLTSVLIRSEKQDEAA